MNLAQANWPGSRLYACWKVDWVYSVPVRFQALILHYTAMQSSDLMTVCSPIEADDLAYYPAIFSAQYIYYAA